MATLWSFAPAAAQTATNVVEVPRDDVTRYPCDLYSYAFCVRKPYGVAVTHRDGPDFTIYQFMRDDAVLFSLYLGRARQDVGDALKRVETFKSAGVAVEVFTDQQPAASRKVEVRVAYRDGTSVHAFGARDQAGREALAETMSTFRSCSIRGFTSLKCREQTLFDKTQANVIRQVE
jgi:hypothetical protein